MIHPVFSHCSTSEETVYVIMKHVARKTIKIFYVKGYLFWSVKMPPHFVHDPSSPFYPCAEIHWLLVHPLGHCAFESRNFHCIWLLSTSSIGSRQSFTMSAFFFPSLSHELPSLHTLKLDFYRNDPDLVCAEAFQYCSDIPQCLKIGGEYYRSRRCLQKQWHNWSLVQLLQCWQLWRDSKR